MVMTMNFNRLLIFIEFNNKLSLSLPAELIEHLVLIILRKSLQLICYSLPGLHCVFWSASVENSCVLSLCVSITTANLSDPVQNTTPAGVLSLCRCSLTLAHTHHLNGYIGWCGCHEGSDQSRRSPGAWHGAGATKSWFDSATLKKSFALNSKCFKTTEMFYLDEKRNAQKWQWNTNRRHNKKNPDDWTIWCGYPRMLVNWTCLCFSLFVCSRMLTVIVVDSSVNIEECLHKLAISFSDLKSWTAKSIFSCQSKWFNPQFELFTLTPE